MRGVRYACAATFNHKDYILHDRLPAALSIIQGLKACSKVDSFTLSWYLQERMGDAEPAGRRSPPEKREAAVELIESHFQHHFPCFQLNETYKRGENGERIIEFELMRK